MDIYIYTDRYIYDLIGIVLPYRVYVSLSVYFLIKKSLVLLVVAHLLLTNSGDERKAATAFDDVLLHLMAQHPLKIPKNKTNKNNERR